MGAGVAVGRGVGVDVAVRGSSSVAVGVAVGVSVGGRGRVAVGVAVGVTVIATVGVAVGVSVGNGMKGSGVSHATRSSKTKITSIIVPIVRTNDLL